MAFVLECDDVDQPIRVISDRGRPVPDVLDSVSLKDPKRVVSEPGVQCFHLSWSGFVYAVLVDHESPPVVVSNGSDISSGRN